MIYCGRRGDEVIVDDDRKSVEAEVSWATNGNVFGLKGFEVVLGDD